MKTALSFFVSFLFTHGFGSLFHDLTGSRLGAAVAIAMAIVVIGLLMIGLDIDAPRSRAGKAAAFGIIAAVLLTCFGH